MVVQSLDGHPSKIKQKITTQIGKKIADNADGMDELIKFLDTIYGKDDMVDVWEKYKSFSSLCRKSDQEVTDFLPQWEMSDQKLKTSGCEYPDNNTGSQTIRRCPFELDRDKISFNWR